MSNDTSTASEETTESVVAGAVSTHTAPDLSRIASWVGGTVVTIGWLALWGAVAYNNYVVGKPVGIALTALIALLPYVVLGAKYLIERSGQPLPFLGE